MLYQQVGKKEPRGGKYYHTCSCMRFSTYKRALKKDPEKKKQTLAFKIKAILLFNFRRGCCSYESFMFISILLTMLCLHSAAKRRLETTGMDTANGTTYHRLDMYSLIKEKTPNFNITGKSFLAAGLPEKIYIIFFGSWTD